ncbi:MAG TPA: NAD(P)H-dependent oxidoreductase [Thiolinea sp.]|nr:NAD(P)H-dependent oxidoreductase [Thiolinea sp.]
MDADNPLRKILILFAHPALEKSRVQYRLLQAARTLEGVTVHDLYQVYPDLVIDIEREQLLLNQHDLILFQHPFYWYSTPAILKEWQDLVLEYGFAYGSSGRALYGKALGNVISTGGSREAYHREGHNYFTVRELLAPFEQTANLCGMHYLPPFVVHGTLRLSGEQMDAYAARYRTLLQRLQQGIPVPGAIGRRQYLNEWPEPLPLA